MAAIEADWSAPLVSARVGDLLCTLQQDRITLAGRGVPTLYGAAFRGDTLDLDIPATEARQKIMREQGLPHDEPVTEIIIPFPTSAQPPKPDPQYEKLTEEERTAFAMACRCCS